MSPEYYSIKICSSLPPPAAHISAIRESVLGVCVGAVTERTATNSKYKELELRLKPQVHDAPKPGLVVSSTIEQRLFLGIILTFVRFDKFVDL